MLWRQKCSLWRNKTSYSPFLILLHFHACVEVSLEIFECRQADARAKVLKLQWTVNDAVNFSQPHEQTLCLWIIHWGWKNLGLLLVLARCEPFLCLCDKFPTPLLYPSLYPSKSWGILSLAMALNALYLHLEFSHKQLVASCSIAVTFVSLEWTCSGSKLCKNPRAAPCALQGLQRSEQNSQLQAPGWRVALEIKVREIAWACLRACKGGDLSRTPNILSRTPIFWAFEMPEIRKRVEDPAVPVLFSLPQLRYAAGAWAWPCLDSDSHTGVSCWPQRALGAQQPLHVNRNWE